MKMKMHLRTPARQRGASLIIGLVLLLVLSVLAVSTMSSATLGLTMTSNAQYGENAFQLADTAIDLSFTGGGLQLPLTAVADPGGLQIGTFTAASVFQETTAAKGSSQGLGAGTFQACHFRITANGTGPRGATATHVQEFYVLCPGS
jgi:Tfp pilus assembly protein PilX